MMWRMLGRRTLLTLTTLATVATVGACGFSVAQDGPRDGGPVGDGPPDVQLPDAGSCVAVEASCASGTVLRDCTTVGQSPMDIECPWGCVASAGPVPAHCGVIVPSGGAVTASDLDPTGLLDIELQGTVDGSTGAISGLRGPGAGVIAGIGYEVKNGVAVFRFRSLHVVGVVALGGTRPIAFVANGEVVIDAVIDARGAPACLGRSGGPGGAAGGLKNDPGGGPGGGEGMSNNNEGGGGGGHGGDGGDGGGESDGGDRFGDDRISVLRGGGGGGGGGGGNNAGQGGGGGGALQIVSNARVTIAATGGINAGGCGGDSGDGGNDGGGGGGAGGAILLEAPVVTIGGILAVNGGGGGARTAAAIGANATLDRIPAPGGTGTGTGGAGAAGGERDGSPGTGITGGGGGGIGRMRFHTRTGMASVAGAATLSPALTDPESRCTQGPATVE